MFLDYGKSISLSLHPHQRTTFVKILAKADRTLSELSVTIIRSNINLQQIQNLLGSLVCFRQVSLQICTIDILEEGRGVGRGRERYKSPGSDLLKMNERTKTCNICITVTCYIKQTFLSPFHFHYIKGW